MVPSSFGCGVAVLVSSTMLAPSLAARSAIASPMPRLPPETGMVFLASVRVVIGGPFPDCCCLAWGVYGRNSCIYRPFLSRGIHGRTLNRRAVRGRPHPRADPGHRRAHGWDA